MQGKPLTPKQTHGCLNRFFRAHPGTYFILYKDLLLELSRPAAHHRFRQDDKVWTKKMADTTILYLFIGRLYLNFCTLRVPV